MNAFTVYPDEYHAQLNQKIARLNDQLATLKQPTLPTIDVFESPTTHYRMRAEFKAWHEGNTTYYAMSDKETRQPVLLETFPVASLAINTLMPKLMAAINQDDILRKKLFQIEFINTLTNDMLVTLIYHRPLSEDWITRATALQETLSISIIGRSRKQKVVLDKDYVTETLTVNAQTFTYRQNEGSFTQPNAVVCQKMLEWAVNNSEPKADELKRDLLELYCGNGNFTLPLSYNFRQVIATEISKSSVNAALENRQKNNIDNVTVVRMSSEDFAEAMDKVRHFRRLKDIDLDSYDFSTVFVDPPRAGLDEHTIEVIRRFDQIIYVSCNPKTLVNNLQSLCNTHEISAIAAFDQFPYTDHLEAAVIIQRKQ
ncbi:tRNA (uridine(54)-C5)-methyltransferase TrmA [Eionea flava]